VPGCQNECSAHEKLHCDGQNLGKDLQFTVLCQVIWHRDIMLIQKYE